VGCPGIPHACLEDLELVAAPQVHVAVRAFGHAELQVQPEVVEFLNHDQRIRTTSNRMIAAPVAAIESALGDE
jgi:hypothetical protein